MKSTLKIALTASLLGISTSSLADIFDAAAQAKQQQAITSGLKEVVKHLDNLGLYLGGRQGWNLSQKPSNPTITSFQEVTNTVNEAVLAIITTLPIVKFSDNIAVLSQNTALSSYVNSAYLDYKKATAIKMNQGTSKTHALEGFDQPAYQQTPTNQAIQNIVSFPSSHLLSVYDPSSKNKPSNSDVEKTLTSAACGGDDNPDCVSFPIWFLSYAGGYDLAGIYHGASPNFPDSNDIANGNYNQKIVPSLSFDSLIAPIIYSPQATTNDDLKKETKNAQLGFYGMTEQAQADAFIRYASGSLLPVTKPLASAYDAKVSQLTNDKLSTLDKAKTIAQLNTYNLMLRSYAAQTSVGMSNLYYLMGKRISNPSLNVNQTGNTKKLQSQSSLEFSMGTRRLFNPDSPEGSKGEATQWLKDIKTASSQNAARQSAILLAEINYQLYLNRQVSERLLASMSVMQLQLLATAKSNISLSAAPNGLAASDSTSTPPTGN